MVYEIKNGNRNSIIKNKKMNCNNDKKKGLYEVLALSKDIDEQIYSVIMVRKEKI